MESYFIRNDYKSFIQEANLQQLITSDDTTLDSIQRSSLAEATSFLKAKFNVASEFTTTELWSFTTAYKANNRVYLDASAYSATQVYALNALTLQAGNIYICITAITVAEAFTLSKWTLLGKQYDLFYVTGPGTAFDLYGSYKKDDVVYYKDKVYTCIKPTTFVSHEQALNNVMGSSVPEGTPINVFPDDATDGVAVWGTGVAYSVTAGTLPTDTTKWTAGDNRDQKILQCCIDIVLYHCHARISPRNIPEHRVSRYIGISEDRVTTASKIIYPVYSALGYFQSIIEGEDVTPQIILEQPKKGQRTRYGGNSKIQNIY